MADASDGSSDDGDEFSPQQRVAMQQARDSAVCKPGTIKQHRQYWDLFRAYWFLLFWAELEDTVVLTRGRLAQWWQLMIEGHRKAEGLDDAALRRQQELNKARLPKHHQRTAVL